MSDEATARGADSENVSAEVLRRLVDALQRKRPLTELPDLARQFGEAAAMENRSAEQVVERMLRAAEDGGVSVPGVAITEALRGFVVRQVGDSASLEDEATGLLASHLARMSALQRISHAATASLDLGAMLQTVVRVVSETVGGDSCSIFLYEPASDSLLLRAAVGLNPGAIDRVRLKLGAGITGTAAARREAVIAPNAVAHPAYLDDPRVGDQSYASQISIPLLLRSPARLVGVLNILSREQREFLADDVTFLMTAADEISVAIENARLYSETDAQLRVRVTQLATLQQLSRSIASTLDLDELLRVITSRIAEISGAAAVEVYGLAAGDESGTRLRLLERRSNGEPPGSPERAERVLALGEEALRTRIPLWSSTDETGDHRFLHVLPMMTARRSVGIICLFHATHPSTIEDDEPFLVAFADAAAIAIENAELYDAARRGYERASTLLQEMHHRVRNNLQTVASLLSMQVRHAGNEGWVQPLQEAISRISSIAAIHDLLSGANLGTTTVEVIARHILEEASATVVRPGLRVRFEVDPSPVSVTSRQATSLALVINELVNNTVRHGFDGRSEGQVTISAQSSDDTVELAVRDDGIGLPASFDPTLSPGLGLQIVRRLVEGDLRGSFLLTSQAGAGTVALIRFGPPR